jgi:hypothetical protein
VGGIPIPRPFALEAESSSPFNSSAIVPVLINHSSTFRSPRHVSGIYAAYVSILTMRTIFAPGGSPNLRIKRAKIGAFHGVGMSVSPVSFRNYFNGLNKLTGVLPQSRPLAWRNAARIGNRL